MCHECGCRADEDTGKCEWRHCFRLFCADCAWHCHGCGDVICPEHTEVYDGEPHCRTCADIIREHAEELFGLTRADCLAKRPCADCGGKLEDLSDPFGDPDLGQVYECGRCGAGVAMRRKPTEALRTAQALRHVTDECPLPPAEYTFTEGRIMGQRKTQAAATKEAEREVA